VSFIDPKLLETIFSGIIVAAAFPIGALIAIYIPYSVSKRALFAAFGAGIFFAAIMLLTQQTLIMGNILDLVIGFSLGAAAFGFAQHQIRHRHHGSAESEEERKAKHAKSEGKLSVVGTVLDSVPETLFVGIIAAFRAPGLYAAVAVLFLGNIATTLEGAKIMQHQGTPKREILRDWLIDFFIVALAAPLGFFLAQSVSQDILAVVLSFAAGTLIVFIAGELIARAYRESTGHNEDLFLSAGFLIGVILLFVV
jgi:zinc transporter, ZIP family